MISDIYVPYANNPAIKKKKTECADDFTTSTWKCDLGKQAMEVPG